MKPEINLNGWCTIKTLAAKNNKTTQYISKLIERGKISYIEVQELNGLKLVPQNALDKE